MASRDDETRQPRVVPAKVKTPQLRVDVVSRPRLLERLEAGRFRVALVAAPTGFGKTVVILDWLHGRGPSAWLSLDPLDNDPARFFHHLAAAVRRLDTAGAGAAADAVERLARAPEAGPGAELLARFEALDPDAVLVLDDVHHLEAAPVLRFLERLLTGLSAGPRIALLSRVDPPLPLGRLRVEGALLELRERDLRFTGPEAAELFARLLPERLAPELIARLEERTEGWAAGLRLAAVSLLRAEDPAAAVDAFTGSHRLMVDYLVEEALAVQDPAVQRFLLETSILPRFTARACVAVTDDPSAAGHLRAVDDANLFLVSLDDRGGWFRYHHLFAELLEHRLRRTRSDVDGLHERASRWFEAEGDLQEALRQASKMDRPDRLLAILDRHGYPILARSEFGAFARWLPHLTDPLSCRWPMFLVALGWFRAQTERAPDIGAVLDAIDRVLADPPSDYPGERLAEARLHREALRSFTLRMRDRLEESLEAGRAVLHRLPPGDSAIGAIVRFNMAAVHLRLAEMEPARELLEASHEGSLRNGFYYLVLAGLAHRGAIAAQLEGLAAARQQLEGAVVFAEREGLASLPAFGIVLYQLAHVHYLADELDPARDLLERALALTAHERETDIHANVLIQLARVEAAAGLHDRADRLLTDAAALAHAHNVKPFATSLDVERARLLAARSGRRQEPESAPASIDPDRWSSVREAEAVLQLQHLLHLDRLEDAAALADRIRAESEPRGRGVALCVARLASAVVSPDPWPELDRALRLAGRRGYVRPLLECGPRVRALLDAAAGQPLEPGARDYARKLAARFPDAPAGRVAASAGSPLPETLTERERETLALLARGLSNKAIARSMYVSVNTVKTHLKHVYAKLDISTRTEAVRRAQALGLADPPDA